MNLLEKFSGLEIKPDTHISDADRRYCAAQQEAYIDARAQYVSLRNEWESFIKRQKEILGAVSRESFEKERYLMIDGISPGKLQGKIEALPDIFISAIVSYFNRTYHVSIDADIIRRSLIPKAPEYPCGNTRIAEYHEAMCEFSLNYEDVLEKIFLQLDGHTFAERAVEELKEKCRSAAWNRYNMAQYEIKNDTIQFTSYACSFEEWLGNPKWALMDGMKDILRGVSHFETGSLEYYPSCISALLTYGHKEIPLFEFSCDKIIRLRMFKNHRVDLKFASKAYAKQFATEYLGFIA